MEASAKAGEGDPSMEEILQSIRKIIADDGDEPAAANANAPASDVLELTEVMAAEPAEETSAPAESMPVIEAAAPAAAPAIEDANDVLSKIDKAVVPEKPVAATAPAAVSPMVANGQAYIDSLLSSESASATSAAFKKIHPVETPIVTTPSAQFRTGQSVEDLVMEALRPMLKGWLDTNLPTIVERIVEREIKKLVS